MRDHDSALQKAILNWVRADPVLQALVGSPARIWDEPPKSPGFPHVRIGRGESRPVAAEGCGVEHRLTLNVVSRFGGTEEARAICAALRVRLDEADLAADGVRVIAMRVIFTDVFRTEDLRRTYAVVRVRAVTEEI